jgi:hypothetical protein
LTSVKVAGDKHYRPQSAWPSLATGCRPDRHGVTRFFHEAAELQAPALWDIYSRQGLTSGVYGWPGAWPPPQIRGFVVPSHLARDDQTWPPDLRPLNALDREQQALDRDSGPLRRLAGAASAAQTLLKHHVRPRTLARLAVDAPSALFGDIEQRRLLLRRAKLEVSADVFLDLCRRYRPSLAAFVTFYVDFVSHRFWRFRNLSLGRDGDRPDLRFKDAVDQSYVEFDAVVGRIVAAAGPDGTIAVVSEHGMEPEPHSAELGSSYFSIRGRRIHELLGLDSSVQTCAVARWIAFRPMDADQIRLTASKLRDITVVETGLPLFQVYEHGAEVIIKFALDANVARYAQGDLERLTARVGSSTVPFPDIARASGRPRSAMHARNGILVIAGPGIRAGQWLRKASILDVAPTLLCAQRLEGADQMDGEPLNVFV